MAVKKSIAIIGATGQEGNEMTERLAQTDSRLLLISDDLRELQSLAERIIEERPSADINTIECVKDGCWEADIILLAIQPRQHKEVAEIMRDVATQKIVVGYRDTIKNTHENLQHLLPHSRLVYIQDNTIRDEVTITGNDEEANAEIASMFVSAGYQSIIENN